MVGICPSGIVFTVLAVGLPAENWGLREWGNEGLKEMSKGLKGSGGKRGSRWIGETRGSRMAVVSEGLTGLWGEQGLKGFQGVRGDT